MCGIIMDRDIPFVNKWMYKFQRHRISDGLSDCSFWSTKSWRSAIVPSLKVKVLESNFRFLDDKEHFTVNIEHFTLKNREDAMFHVTVNDFYQKLKILKNPHFWIMSLFAVLAG